MFFLYGFGSHYHYPLVLPLVVLLGSAAMVRLLRKVWLISLTIGFMVFSSLHVTHRVFFDYLNDYLSEGKNDFWPATSVQNNLARSLQAMGIRHPLTTFNEIKPCVVFNSCGRSVPVML